MSAPFKSLSRLAWRNVVRYRKRSLATGLAIAAGFAAVAVFDGFLKDVRFVQDDGFSSRGMLGDIVIQKKGASKGIADDLWLYSLDPKEQNFVTKFAAKNPIVQNKVSMLEVKGMISNGTNTAMFMGSSHDVQEGLAVRSPRWQWNTLAGKPLHMQSSDQFILSGLGLGKMMGCKPDVDVFRAIKRGGGYIAEDRPFTCKTESLMLSVTTERAQINAMDLQVSGLMDHGFRQADQHFVMMPLTTAQRLLDTDRVTLIALKLTDGSKVSEVVDQIRAESLSAGIELEVESWRSHQIGSFVRNVNDILDTFRSIFMTIVVVIVTLSVSNTMMKSVSERIREIGTLRSFGFRVRDILALFTLEGFFLSVSSCLVGVAVSLLISFLINQLGVTYRAGLLSVPVFVSVSLDVKLWIVNSIWLIGLSSLIAWFASRRGAKLQVADALRH